MQLSALFRWWIYIAIVHAPVVLSSSFSLERALFDVAPDESLFSNEFSLEETDPSNQDVAPDWNGLLADNDLDPITEFDLNRPLAGEGYLDESGSNFLLADNDVACDSDAENTQLFGKVRRENLCRDPRLGQTGGFSQKDPFDEFNKLFTITDPLAPFPEDSETCPKRNFENSNIPVCKEEIPPDDIVPIPRTRAFSLFNIDPVIFPRVFLQCPQGITLWCCQSILYSPRSIAPTPLGENQFNDLSDQESLDAFRRYLTVARYKYAGVICYRQAFPPM